MLSALAFAFVLLGGRALAARWDLPIVGWALTYPALLLVGLLTTNLGGSLTQVLWVTVFFSGITALVCGRRSLFGLTQHHLPLLVSSAIYFLWLCYQGPYLELPSDPIGVHLFRIGDWLYHPQLTLSTLWAEITSHTGYPGYLWNAALVSGAGTAPEKALPFLNHANSLLFFLCFYVASYQILKNSLLAVASFFIWGLATGTEGYAYLRYYTFSPGFLNLAALFDLGALWFASPARERLGIKLGLLGWVAIALFLTHKQEVIFAAIFLASLVPALLAPELSFGFRNRFLKVMAFLVVVSGVLYAFAYRSEAFRFSSDLLAPAWLIRPAGVLVNPSGPRVSGTLNGALGLLALFSLCLYPLAKRYRPKDWARFLTNPLPWISLAPFLLLFLVPFCFLTTRHLHETVFFRLFYLNFLPILVLALVRLVSLRTLPLAFGTLAFLLAAFIYPSPGKHLLGKLPPGSSLDAFPEIPLALKELGLPVSEIIITDSLTSYALPFLTGHKTLSCPGWRCIFPPSLLGTSSQAIHSERLFQEFLARFCTLLVNRSSKWTPSHFPYHWPEEVREVSQYYHPQFEVWVARALKAQRLKLVVETETFAIYQSLTCPAPFCDRKSD